MRYSADLRPVVDSVFAPSFGAAPDPVALWRTVTGLGWHRIGVDEAAGGVGGDLADLAELAAGLGRHAVALPLLDTALAAWTLARCGRSADVLGDEPAVVVALPPGRDAPTGVRYLPVACHVVLLLADGGVVLRRRAELTVRESHDLADDPVGEIVLDSFRATVDESMSAPRTLVDEVVGRSAVLTAAALGGCVERAAQLVTEHVSLRRQFGRPLLAQQAVAHGVAALACDRDIIATSVDAALATPTPAQFAAARATAARSAGDAARVAHQLMGAMGITREHPLQLVTRRIWTWRDAGRSQRGWEQTVGEHVLAGDGDEQLWQLVTATTGAGDAPPQHAHAVLHCNLNTDDVERSTTFHRSAFDLVERMRSHNLDDDGTPMGLGPHTSSVTAFLYDRRGPRAAPAVEVVGWQHPLVAPRDAGSTGPATIGYRTADLAAASEAVRAAGGSVAEVEGGVLVRGRLRPTVIATDPDGVTVELVEIAPAPDDRGTTALSHERLCCADLDASVAWYGVIGWVVRGRSADGTAVSLVLPDDPTFSLELQHDPTVRTTRPSSATTRGLYRIALAVEDVQAAHDALEAHTGAPVPDPWFFAMPDVPTGGFTALFLADPDGVVVELVERPRAAVRRPTQPR